MNCIIIHGCPGDEEKAMDSQRRSYDKHWIPWAKTELEKKGIKTITPLMPNPWRPDYESYKKFFEQFDIDEETVLIGHSCGCAFLVRWLGDTGKKIRKLILVAPWKLPSGTGERYENRRNFYEYPIDKKIRDNVQEIVIFTSDDEEEDGKISVKMFHQVLGGHIIEIRGYGHYCLNGNMKSEEFPQLIKEVIKR
ncbi:MAG: alpha/beta hydrolase [Nanoarchaeota archaeon]